MKHVIHRLPRINGRRGAFQILFGLVYGCLALAMVGRFPSSISFLGEYLPHWTMTVLWSIPALAALVGAFMPRPKDVLSFALMTFTPVLSGFLFVVGAIVDPANASPYGPIVYWALGGAVMVVSGMSGDSDRDEREVTTCPSKT